MSKTKRIGLIIAIMLMIPITLLILSGCSKNEKNQTIINFYGEEKYSELSNICTEDKKIKVAIELVEKAKNILSDTKREYTADMVGALEKYSYYDTTITDVEIDIELITTEQSENTGYVWVRYSAMYYRNNDLVQGSQDVISRWTIEKRNNLWEVTLIEEQ